MKKVARLRIPMQEEMASTGTQATTNNHNEISVRTTGRIKKPKAVFDPSDNYLPRSQRLVSINQSQYSTSASSQSTPQASALNAATPVGTGGNARGGPNNRSFSIDGTSPVSPDACIVCQKREAKRSSYANKNKLISCLKCERKIHKLCLDIECEDFDYLRQNYNCENCRNCEICNITFKAILENRGNNEKEFITCIKCLKSYHPGCHNLSIATFPHGWKCYKCIDTVGTTATTTAATIPVAVSINKCTTGISVKEQRKQQQQQQQVNGDAISMKALREIIGDDKKVPNTFKYQNNTSVQKVNIAAAAAEAKASLKRSNSNDINISDKRSKCLDSENGKDLQNNNNNNNNNSSFITYCPTDEMDIPDVKHWSVDQVTDYFSKYFPQEAYVFKDQEIDGTSLLLLKRSDVIKKLPIKLGPSLRMYNLILKIQSQSNDATLGWNCDI